MFWWKQITSTRPATENISSILISILYLVGIIAWPCNSVKHCHRGRPYVYSPTVIIQCFIFRIWFRLDSNRSLHHFLSVGLSYNIKVVKACGLSLSYTCQAADEPLTGDWKLFLMIYKRERISTMGNLFVLQELVKPSYIFAIDYVYLTKIKR